MESTVWQQMNQRQWALDNHSKALCGEIKSRTFLHLPVSVWCVSGLAGSPWETGLQLLSWGDLNTNTRWLMALCIRHDGFLGSYLWESCSRRFTNVRRGGQHVRMTTDIISWGVALKCFSQRVWCLTSWAHNHAGANWEIESVLSHELWHLGPGCSGVTNTNAKSIKRMSFVRGSIDIS